MNELINPTPQSLDPTSLNLVVLQCSVQLGDRFKIISPTDELYEYDFA